MSRADVGEEIERQVAAAMARVQPQGPKHSPRQSKAAAIVAGAMVICMLEWNIVSIVKAIMAQPRQPEAGH